MKYGLETEAVTEFLVLIQKYRLQIFKHHHDEMLNTVKLAQEQ